MKSTIRRALLLAVTSALPFSSVSAFFAETPNQIAVNAELLTLVAPTPDQLLFLTALAALPPLEQEVVLDELSGQQYTNSIVAAEIAGHQFIRRLYDPLRSIVTTQPCPCEDVCCDPCPTFDVWVEGGGGRTELRGDANASRFHFDGYEVTGGVQSTFNKEWTVGIAGSYAHDKVHYNLGGSGKHQVGFVGLYGLYRPNNWYALADATFGYHEHRTRRTFAAGAFAFEATSKPKIYEGSGYIEAGYDLPWNCILFQPFLGFDVNYFERDRFTETGSPFNLVVHKKNHTNVHSRLGVHLTSNGMPMNTSISVDLAWQYRITSLKNSITENFETFGTPFVIHGSKFNRNSGDGAITISTTVADNFEIYAQASGEIWSRASTYNFLGGIKFSW